MLELNIQTERVKKLQIAVNALSNKFKIVSVSLYVVMLLTVANISLGGLSLLNKQQSQQLSIATLGAAILGGISSVVNLKYRSSLKKQLSKKELEILAEISPESCCQKIQEYKLSETLENLKGVKINILENLAELGSILEVDFWFGRNGRYILTPTAYQALHSRVASKSAFNWLMYDSFIDVLDPPDSSKLL